MISKYREVTAASYAIGIEEVSGVHPLGAASAYFARLSLRVSAFNWINMMTEMRCVFIPRG